MSFYDDDDDDWILCNDILVIFCIVL